MDLVLPAPPISGGVYRPAAILDRSVCGVFGKEFSKEDGPELSRNAMLNVLAVLNAEIGDLNLIEQPVKITTFDRR